MKKQEQGKIIQMTHPKCADYLLMQLEELTDPRSIYFDQDVFDQKDEIKEKILKGEITLD